jgi:hypothetical protein
MAALSAATIVAGVSAATALTGTTMSFVQAGQAKAKAADAAQAANKAIAEAKSKLDVNFYDALGIQKEPYELQREALLASGAQALEAGRESERGAAATAGRIQMAQNEQQAGVRTSMGQELTALERLSAAEDSRLRDVGAQISLAEAEGAQSAVADFNSMAGRATTQGLQGIVQTGEAVSGFVPLYMKSKGIDPNTGLKIVPPAPAPNATTAPATTAPVAQAVAAPVAQAVAAPVVQAVAAPVAQAATAPVTQAVTAPVTQAVTAPVTTIQTTDGQAVADLTSMPTNNTVPVVETQAVATPAPAPQPNKNNSLTFYDPNLDISPFNFPNRATTEAEKQKIFKGNYKFDPVTKKYVPLWDF